MDISARLAAASSGVAGLARFIDHTLLKPEATRAQIERLCAEAEHWSVFSVCVNPVWVEAATRRLGGSPVAVYAVVGFPLGATLPEAKAHEARLALAHGANEIDMVLDVGGLKSGETGRVRDDVAAVAEVVHAVGGRLKVILETALLTDAEKVEAARLAAAASADFVKTSTGFGPGGATVADVRLLRETVGPDLGVKASGGIRRLDDALALLEAGASRLGMSATVAVLEAARERFG